MKHIYKINNYLFWMFIVICSLALTGCGNTPEYDTYLTDTDYDKTMVSVEDNNVFSTSETTEYQTLSQSTIYVDICGAVKYPGVYQLSENARMFDAVEAAGGLCDYASLEAINQAELVTDAQKIYIMTKSEWNQKKSLVEEDSSSVDDGKVNINIADKNTLCTLPGIGETRADAIIAYREKSGGFTNIEDIQKVSGIKNGTYNKICDLIKVE